MITLIFYILAYLAAKSLHPWQSVYAVKILVVAIDKEQFAGELLDFFDDFFLFFAEKSILHLIIPQHAKVPANYDKIVICKARNLAENLVDFKLAVRIAEKIDI